MKRELSSCETVKFTIFCNQGAVFHRIKSVEPTINKLSTNIARKIVELNGKTPAAVICIGGGSLMPGLAEYIAAYLELPKDYAGIRGREGLSFISGCEDFTGPFSVTPIGIAINALEGTHLSFIKFT